MHDSAAGSISLGRPPGKGVVLGDDSFREGLEVLVTALRTEARLNGRGEAFIYPRLIGHLAQRLQVEDWYRRHPEIDDVAIVAPLIGIGLPRPRDEDVSLVLETPSRPVRIDGETVLSTHDVYHNDEGTYSGKALKQEMPDFPALQQAGVRYQWDGEQAYGMLERSNPLDKITRD